ncbi:hypothetical protein [Lichenibacterium ramalinae]|uniref:Uncharacterized protein n=1 Tax=Lichenibacterium ramalinae TaxID=2316527 RepID=A0A4Q2RG55_9HYPH|nr:hypothetical protein [Lichenibacterium ramalinae]RYB07176.1 hypothetical protein D3272_03695 [Lichenibacterium ramalinae]
MRELTLHVAADGLEGVVSEAIARPDRLTLRRAKRFRGVCSSASLLVLEENGADVLVRGEVYFVGLSLCEVNLPFRCESVDRVGLARREQHAAISSCFWGNRSPVQLFLQRVLVRSSAKILS